MLKPLSDHVVVKPLTKEGKTEGGIILPDTAKEKPQEGEVIAVGPGRLLENGTRVQPEVKTGDKVIFAKYGATEVKIEGVEHLIMKESDILAVKE